MKRSKTNIRILLIALMLTFISSGAMAQQVEPTPEGAYRELRSDYLKNWYVYADTNTDGILNPGDRNVGAIQNWWTTVSSGTQHNLNEGPYQPGNYTFGDDVPSAPMSYADHGYASKNVWLPRKEDRLGFYMSYSQSDNNTQNFWHSMRGDGTNPWLTSLSDYYKEKYEGTNGWALGWIVNDIKRLQDGSIDPDSSPAGTLLMDIMVHKGAGTYDYGDWGQSISNPQVTQSNDISSIAKDPYNGLRYPVKFNDATGQYDPLANLERMDWWTANGDTLTAADIAAIATSMDVKERQAMSAWLDAIYPDKTPQEILNDLGYEYEDAFSERSIYANNSTDGGVIGGLSGYNEYNHDDNNWADQQVIRIDLSDVSLHDITEVAFYDFGYAPGSSQLVPMELVLNVDDTGTLFFDANGDDLFNAADGDIYFPENRIYIGMVGEMLPEPGMMALLGAGGVGLLMKRRRNRK
jgi:hypothetical protein